MIGSITINSFWAPLLVKPASCQRLAFTVAVCFFLLPSLSFAIDSDNDGLDDSVETNTGVYVSPADTGSDPNDRDTDKDSIPDGLDLPPGRSPLVADWMVSTGYTHVCVLDDSKVLCWDTASEYGMPVPDIPNPRYLTSKFRTACAIADDGMYCWGDGPTTRTTSALTILSSSIGEAHRCLLTTSGVSCSGDNSYGQTDVPPLSNPVAISAGYNHNCALDDSGVVCWGDDTQGQSTVPPLSNPKQVSAGLQHTCALDDSGVVCWGYNHPLLLQPPPLSNPVQVSAGREHTCALDDNGVVCWGIDHYGQTAVPPLNNPVQVRAGGTLSCALDDNGVTCWGYQISGDTPLPVPGFDKDRDGGPDATDPLPLDPSESADTDGDGIGNNADTDDDNDGLPDSIEDANSNGIVDSGETDPLNSDSDNDGVADGIEDLNHNGIVDIGETDATNPDTDADGMLDGREDANGNGLVDAGEPDPRNPDSDNDTVPDGNDAFPTDASESVDTDRDGIGNNADTDDDNDTIPDNLDQPPGRDPLVPDWSVHAGYQHNCAMDDTGVVCWGKNDFGQTSVPTLSNPVMVSAGFNRSCALDDTGAVCWGSSTAFVPQLVNPVTITATGDHACAIDDSGVVCWDGNQAYSNVPGLVFQRPRTGEPDRGECRNSFFMCTR